MAVVKMKRFSLFTTESHKPGLLKSLQRFGSAQFKNIENAYAEDPESKITKDTAGQSVPYYEGELASVKSAIAQLKLIASDTADPPQMSYAEFESFLSTYDYKYALALLKTLEEDAAQAKSEAQRLAGENEALRAYEKLDISVKSLDRLKYAKSLVGTVLKTGYESFKAKFSEAFPESYLEAVCEIKQDVLLIAFFMQADSQKVQPFLTENGFARSSLPFDGVPSEIIASNEEKIASLKEKQKKANDDKASLEGEYQKLSIAADCISTILEREKVTERFLKTQSTLVIEGWVPADEYGEFLKAAEAECGEDYYIESEDVEKESEDVPIKLKNNILVRAFENITAMYSMPKYAELDPTPILAPFYMFFFGLMVGDTGYGLVLSLACGYMLWKGKLKPSAKSFISFFFWLGVATTLCGFLFGSFFGFTFFAPVTMADGTKKALFDSQKDITLMLVLSIGIGVFQIVSALIFKGYALIKEGKFFSAIFDSLFFILVILSGVGAVVNVAGVLPSIGGMSQAQMGKILLNTMFAMMIGIGLTAGRTSESIGGKIGNGIYTVYGLTSYVGDFVSYTRIVALMLSGAYIGFAFNKIAGLVWTGGFIGKIGAVAISVVGNLLNFGLGALGAYVHTCRLQFVEFFGKFYEGGGVPYVPFAIKNDFISLK